MRAVRTWRVGRAALAAVLWCSAGPAYAALPWLHVEGNKIKDPGGQEVVLRGISLIDLGYTESRHGGAIRMIDRITDLNDPQGNSPGWYPRIVRIPICPPDAGTGAPPAVATRRRPLLYGPAAAGGGLLREEEPLCHPRLALRQRHGAQGGPDQRVLARHGAALRPRFPRLVRAFQ